MIECRCCFCKEWFPEYVPIPYNHEDGDPNNPIYLCNECSDILESNVGFRGEDV